MPHQNRREFLQGSATLAAAAALPVSLFGQAPGRAVRGWVTAPGKAHAAVEVRPWAAWKAVSPVSIHLDPDATKQEVLGFGGAFTDASCFLLSKMAPDARHALLEELYGKSGLRLSVGRTTIGASDYSLTAYSYDDVTEPDPELAHFSIDHDRAYVLPMLKESAAVNPELFLFGSPWSPPGWMKASHTLIGGNMRDHYFPAYAQYFVKYLKGYADAGVTMAAVTVQNEVDSDQDERMPQAEWGQEYEIGFVAKHLGPALQQAGLKTKIWFLDHNYNLWGRAVDSLSDPDFYKYVDGVAWHGYYGSVESMTRVHDMFPAKNAYWTEGGPGLGPKFATDWTKWSSTFTGVLRNWSKAIVSWNLLLDEQGRPNIGPFKCAGVVQIDSQTKALSRSGQYHAFAHYSKHIERGARIFATHGDLPDVDHVAAQNPDGSRVLLLTNRGQEQRLQAVLGTEALEVLLPADSVTTLVW